MQVNGTSGRHAEAVVEAKKRLPMAAWLQRQGVSTKKAGSGTHVALCPFHGDKQPSLHLYDDHYHCFACQAHGDHITWLRELQGLSFVEAAELLAAEAGVVLPESVHRKRLTPDRRAQLYAANRVACEWFQTQLFESQDALAYLHGRGLTDDTILEWRLGLNPTGNWKWLER